jgi:hypothetical protein
MEENTGFSGNVEECIDFDPKSRIGDVFTWGSGEMGQLGYSQAMMGKMPKDRDG